MNLTPIKYKRVRIRVPKRVLFSKGRRLKRPRFKGFYRKRVSGTKMLSPKVQAFARRHHLRPSRSLVRGQYGTYYSGRDYLTIGKGKLRIKKRTDY